MRMANRIRAPRIYIDTSVVGGCLDEEFREASVRLLDKCRAGEVILIISDTLTSELEYAPPGVRRILEGLPRGSIERVLRNEATDSLADEYLRQGVVPPKMIEDARHISLATVAKVDVVVSWNFKHIVNLDRIHAFNSVNLRLGYPMLEIRSPLEV